MSNFLHGFDRTTHTKTTTRNILGIEIKTDYYLFGNRIYRFDFFGKLVELWHIPRSSQDTFQYLKPEQIRQPIAIELAKYKRLTALPYRLLTLLLPKSIQYTKIYEMFGDHDIESSLYRSNKNLLFIRSKYLIKLAMDLKLLKQRDAAKQTQDDIGRSINSFDITLANNESFDNDLDELNSFNLIQHCKPTVPDIITLNHKPTQLEQKALQVENKQSNH